MKNKHTKKYCNKFVSNAHSNLYSCPVTSQNKNLFYFSQITTKGHPLSSNHIHSLLLAKLDKRVFPIKGKKTKKLLLPETIVRFNSSPSFSLSLTYHSFASCIISKANIG